MNQNSSKVLVLGAWHLGSVVGACLADAGHTVFLWDQDPRVQDKWTKGVPPIQEPGLNDLVGTYWNKRLFWKDLTDEVLGSCDWVVIAYDTPVNDKDEVLVDSVIQGFSSLVRKALNPKCNFLVTSQLPVGTSRNMQAELKNKLPQWKGHLMYQPENLRLGEALKSFRTPDRVVVGFDTDIPSEKTQLAQGFRNLIGNQTVVLNEMNLESAEMVKHALNSFLGMCVVFANEISNLCELKGANAWDVLGSLKQDTRVGSRAFLTPGLGFSGGTLARDVRTLSRLKDSSNASLFSKLYELNSQRNDWILERLHSEVGDIKGKKIVLLGVTYKPHTSTVRRSIAIEISAQLAQMGAQCVAVDPMADLTELTENELKSLNFELVSDPMVALSGASAAIVLTEWPLFAQWNWADLKQLMSTPLVIDTKNLLKATPRTETFRVIVPGRPQEVTL